MSEERASYKLGKRKKKPPPSTLKLFSDQGYESPNGEDVRTLLNYVGLTGSTAADLVGVTSRTVRRWTGNDREIPYAAWRILLIYAGLVQAEIIFNSGD